MLLSHMNILTRVLLTYFHSKFRISNQLIDYYSLNRCFFDYGPDTKYQRWWFATFAVVHRIKSWIYRENIWHVNTNWNRLLYLVFIYSLYKDENVKYEHFIMECKFSFFMNIHMYIFFCAYELAGFFMNNWTRQQQKYIS